MHKRVAWGLFIVSVVVSVASVFLSMAVENAGVVSDRGYRFDAIAGVAFSFLGAFVASKRPNNTIGWLMTAIGISGSLGAFLPEYGTYGSEVADLPLTSLALWIGVWIWIPFVMFVPTFLLLLYPNGHLPSSGWRHVARVASGGLVGFTLAMSFMPFEASEKDFAENPYGIEGLETALTVLAAVSGIVIGLCVVASIYSLFWRRKRATPVERQQLRWFALGAAAMPILFTGPEAIVDTSSWPVDPTVSAFLVPPIAMVVAIARYRLYDIDRIINRTLVYGSLTALLVGFYLISVVGLQLLLEPITSESDLVVAASTLAAAAAVRPLRSGLQRFIDRRFYRRKYDATRALDGLARRLRDEVELAVVGADVVEIVHETVQPAHVSLWLRDPFVTISGRSAGTQEA